MKDNNLQYIIELDGNYYRCTENGVEQISDPGDVKGDVWFFTDLGGGVSRSMTVEAPYKYADIMVRKNLQESGEFDEPLSVLTHWKKKKNANTTDIFFTAFSVRLFHQLIDRTKASEDNVLIFPIYSILHKIIKRMSHPRPVAVIFQHYKYAEVIIGTPNNIFYAERCVSFDESEDQISALWNMLGSEIQNVETENRIKVDKILFLTWIDSKKLPELPEEIQSVLYPMEEESLTFEGENYPVSFLKAAQMMSGYESFSEPMEKVCYYSRKILPFINAVLLFATILFVAGSMWCWHYADLVEENIQGKIAKTSNFRIKAGIPEVPYKETYAFIKKLDRYQKTPSLKEVLEDISKALPSQMVADVLKVDYEESMLKAEIFVKTESPFNSAYKGYQNFLSIMKQKGYGVRENKFDTSIQDSQFLVVLDRKIL